MSCRAPSEKSNGTSLNGGVALVDDADDQETPAEVKHRCTGGAGGFLRRRQCKRGWRVHLGASEYEPAEIRVGFGRAQSRDMATDEKRAHSASAVDVVRTPAIK
jgi:hypothetical protein